MEKEIHALIGQLKTSDTDHPNIEKYIKFCTDNTSKILFATRKIAKLARQHGIVKSYNKKDNGEPIRKLSLKKTHLKAETLGLVRANLEYLIRSLTLASLIRDTGGDTIIIEEAFLTIFETERTV